MCHFSHTLVDLDLDNYEYKMDQRDIAKFTEFKKFDS